ncbi:hypothetical protein B0H11DRAFT_1911280 [Mycena galericulata]|nr:hypothetical protein B0H11DRAFT_1911280 [Mycena galericulata]
MIPRRKNSQIRARALAVLCGDEEYQQRRRALCDNFVLYTKLDFDNAFKGHTTIGSYINGEIERMIKFFAREVTDPTKRRSVRTSRTMMMDCYSLLCQFTKMTATTEHNWKTWFERLDRLFIKLRTLQYMTTHTRTKVWYGLPEQIQFSLLFLTMAFGGFRPGSLLSQPLYREFYSVFKHWTIWTTDIPGVFKVYLDIVTWKGGHTGRRFKRTYQLSSTRYAAHLLLDVGVFIVTLGLQRGAFRDHSSMDSVLLSKNERLYWSSEMENRPVFLNKSHGPLSGTDANQVLRQIAREAYLPGNTRQPSYWMSLICSLADIQNLTLYAFRRGAITKMLAIWGQQLTKVLVKHRQNSDAVAQNYSYRVAQVDMSGIAVGKDSTVIEGSSIRDGAAFHRAQGAVEYDLNAIKSAIRSSSECAAQASEIMLLRTQIREVSPDLSFLSLDLRSRCDDDIHTLLAYLERRFRALLIRLGKKEVDRQYQQAEQAGRALVTVETVEARKSEQNEISKVILDIMDQPDFQAYLPGRQVDDLTGDIDVRCSEDDAEADAEKEQAYREAFLHKANGPRVLNAVGICTPAHDNGCPDITSILYPGPHVLLDGPTTLMAGPVRLTDGPTRLTDGPLLFF